MAGPQDTGKDQPVTIKKYANRRLYNTATSSYVTLEALAEMVRSGDDFVVYDAKSGEDITRSVLTQIIFDAENKGHSLLPVGFLRQLITYYGDSMQSLVPGYLEMSMDMFTRNQEKMRGSVEQAFGQPFRQFEDMSRRNIEAFQRAVSMTNPFKADQENAAPPSSPPPAAAPEDEFADLRAKLDAMQQQLNALLARRD